MVVDHRLCAGPGFLGGLEQRDQRPAPVFPRPCEQLGRADQPGDMHVVAASVHHREPYARPGPSPVTFAGVRQAGVLPDRQRIHVGA